MRVQGARPPALAKGSVISHVPAKCVAWLPAAESNFFDDCGRSAALYKIRYTGGELMGDHEDLEAHEIEQSKPMSARELAQQNDDEDSVKSNASKFDPNWEVESPDEDSDDDWGGRPDEDSDDDWGGRPAELATSMSPGILDCLWPNVQPVTEKFYALLKARDVTVLDAIARSAKLLYTEEKSRTRRAVEAAEIVSAKTEALVKAVLEDGEEHQIALSRERNGSFGFGFYSTSGGLLVSLITAGGAAVCAGLCYGDVVLSIDGCGITDFEGTSDIDHLKNDELLVCVRRQKLKPAAQAAFVAEAYDADLLRALAGLPPPNIEMANKAVVAEAHDAAERAKAERRAAAAPAPVSSSVYKNCINWMQRTLVLQHEALSLKPPYAYVTRLLGGNETIKRLKGEERAKWLHTVADLKRSGAAPVAEPAAATPEPAAIEAKPAAEPAPRPVAPPSAARPPAAPPPPNIEMSNAGKRPAAVVAKTVVGQRAVVGDLVDFRPAAAFGKTLAGGWRRGRCARVHAGKTSSRDPTFDVVYDGSTVEPAVRLENIRRVGPAPPPRIRRGRPGDGLERRPEIPAKWARSLRRSPQSERQVQILTERPGAVANGPYDSMPPPQPRAQPRPALAPFNAKESSVAQYNYYSALKHFEPFAASRGETVEACIAFVSADGTIKDATLKAFNAFLLGAPAAPEPAAIETELAPAEPEITDAPTTARPTRNDKIPSKWRRLPAPRADAIARARAPATSNLPELMTGSDDVLTTVRGPLQWLLERGAKPGPADVYEVLNVLVPSIHGLNHTGVAFASQTLGCTQVPDEFKDFRALQCLFTAAPQSLHKNLPSLLVSYRPLARIS
jgi:hypothetical protein